MSAAVIHLKLLAVIRQDQARNLSYALQRDSVTMATPLQCLFFFSWLKRSLRQRQEFAEVD